MKCLISGMMKKEKRITAAILLILLLITVCTGVYAYTGLEKDPIRYKYGVFLGVNSGKKAMRKFRKYETIVLDVQNGFDRDDIRTLKDRGHRVLSYINVGAVENYRDYYNDYLDLTLGKYDNWPDERWVDVSVSKWQDFILKDLSERIMDTGVDGFFVDNIDVYYHYHSEPIYTGVETILKGLKEKGDVIVNGGDTFVTEYIEKGEPLDLILDGINQETVFSAIKDYDRNKFGENNEEERDFFLAYTESVRSRGKDVYLLEYTRSRRLKKIIEKGCRERGYDYYISRSLDLK